MTQPHATWSDEQVHAFVDGELDAAAAAQLQASLPRDAALAARVARQQALRAQLHAAFDPVLRESVPERLQQAIKGAGGAATPIGAAPRRASRPLAPAPLWWAAAAASVLAAILVGWNLPRSAGDALLVSADAGLLAAGALDDALSNRISAAGPDPSGVEVSLTIQTGEGRYCRVFGLASGVDGLACRTATGWQVEATGHVARDAGEDYRQAASALSPAVVSAISSRQPGEALTPEQEQQARDKGWR